MPDGKSNWAHLLTYKDKEKPKGRSTLTKYECPHCGLKVRVGIKDDPRLVHDSCSAVFGEKVFLVKADGKVHDIYKAWKKDQRTFSDQDFSKCGRYRHLERLCGAGVQRRFRDKSELILS